MPLLGKLTTRLRSTPPVVHAAIHDLTAPLRYVEEHEAAIKALAPAAEADAWVELGKAYGYDRTRAALAMGLPLAMWVELAALPDHVLDLLKREVWR